MKVFDYTRKSQEDNDRQVQSFEKQIEAILSIRAPYDMIFEPVYRTIPQESKTGKIPRIRPLFNDMMDNIENHLSKGDKIGVRAWRITRLARNAPDASRVIDAVQNGLTIFTPYKIFRMEEIGDLYHEFAKAHVFSNELSRDVKEGMATKLQQGKYPSQAPIGYRNTPEKPQGLREILVDEERFSLVQKMWKMLLTGKHNPQQIRMIATDEWGLRNRNGKPISYKQIYDIFTNIFYTGKYFNYGGQLYDNGIHKPMITLDEFELGQRILGSRGKPFNATREFSYTNWLKCVCGSSITAEERFKRYCYECNIKYNAELHDVCPKCKIVLSKNLIHLTSYHCSRKLGKCNQPSISLNNLEMQIDKTLETLELPQEYIDWALESLREDNEQEITQRQAMTTSLHSAVVGVDKRLDNLSYKYTSPENQNGEIYTDAEYINLKNTLKEEKLKLETQIQQQNKRQDTWMDNAEKAFNFVKHCRYWFKHGTKQEKRAIFQCMSSYPILKDKKLSFQLQKPFEAIKKLAELTNGENKWFVPRKQLDNTPKSHSSRPEKEEVYPWCKLF